MSDLKNKSEISLLAAELLHKNSLYPSVSHCAYYSCYQLMKHIWLFTLHKTDVELAALIRNETKGSHEVLINQISEYLKGKIDLENLRDFNSSILQLKRLRHTSDYENVQIDSTKSNNSILLAKTSTKIIGKFI